MGKGGGRKEKPSETPKRKLSDNEISPSLVKESKFIKMPISEEDFKKQSSDIASIMRKLDKLDLLDSMKDEISQIKTSQTEMCNSFKVMEHRVETLERDVSEMRESKSVEQLQDEVRRLNDKNNALETKIHRMTAQSNDSVNIRNLPANLCQNDEEAFNVVGKVLTALGMPLDWTQYTVQYKPDTINRLAIRATVKFSTSMLKAKVIKRFRDVKNATNYDGELLVERVFQLPMDHQLNGTHLAMSNVLTQHNLELLKHARKFVDSHFAFVFDTPHGLVKVNLGKDNFKKVETIDDVQRLIEEIERNSELRKKPIDKPIRPQKTPVAVSDRNTRSGKKSQGIGG